MLLRVVYRDGCFDYVKPQLLERLIQTNKLKYFYRESGVAAPGVDRVRSTQEKPYAGIDRRDDCR